MRAAEYDARMRVTRGLVVMVFGGSLGACGPEPADSSGTGSSGTATSASGSSGTTGASGTSEAVPTSSGSGNFAAPPDLPGPGMACDPWQASACPPGQKCKPYASPLAPWIGASCVPVVERPTPTGEPCSDPEDSFTDTCEDGAVCHGFSQGPDSLRCQELCQGSPAEWTCADACSWCFANGGLAGVCMLTCDPRAFACPEGQTCQILATAPRFACAHGTGTSAAGESCDAAACVEGAACVDAALVPGCAGTKCCAPVCTLGEAGACADRPGTSCVSWPVSGPEFEAGCLPAGLGLCAAG